MLQRWAFWRGFLSRSPSAPAHDGPWVRVGVGVAEIRAAGRGGVRIGRRLGVLVGGWSGQIRLGHMQCDSARGA